MHVEFLVEELSLKVALDNLLLKILPEDEEITFVIHDFQGKKNLLKKLPQRLKGYRQWLPDDNRIVVLIDEDRQDCMVLKKQLETIAKNAGFVTKTAARSEQKFQVLNRIVIEELEAWFFGDIEAICAAYPKVSSNLGTKAKYRNPDAITGGTWEALERELRGYYPGGLNKLMVARDISQYMEPNRNCSKSFKVFVDGLLQLMV
jgi:hypothetical protein